MTKRFAISIFLLLVVCLPAYGVYMLTRAEERLQVQPVHRDVYGDALDRFEIVEGLEKLGPADWEDFRNTVSKPMGDPHRQRGEYAVQTRKRRQGEEPPTES